MIAIESLDPLPDRWRGAYLAIGNFDGVHRGHAQLVECLRTLAHRAGRPAIALTFDPPPTAILRPGLLPEPLTWLERRVELLRHVGASEVGVFRTGRWLLDLPARDFFDRVLRQQFDARGLVEGPTFGFGRDRAGNVETLAAWCAENGMEFEVVTPTTEDGQLISSTRIRRVIEAGDVAEAAALLGRPHRLRGTVVRGAGRGSGLGFATANLSGVDTLLPADGVYAVAARLDSKGPWLAGAAHVGPNSTFGEQSRSIETHLIDFPYQPLYDHHLEVDLLARLRGSIRFDGIAFLIEQMTRDVESARRIVQQRVTTPLI